MIHIDGLLKTTYCYFVPICWLYARRAICFLHLQKSDIVIQIALLQNFENQDANICFRICSFKIPYSAALQFMLVSIFEGIQFML